MSLPLSKTLDPADFDSLAEELAIVDEFFTKDREQHPMRRWEYAMALRAIDYPPNLLRAHRLADVGGAGSPFRYMAGEIGWQTEVIDPDQPFGCTLADYFQKDYAQPFQRVTCLSVLEHVDDLDRFLYHLSCLVAPGGLLFLTMDYCDGYAEAIDSVVPDTYHFHWMRKRIFNVFRLAQITHLLHQRDFTHLGPYDFSWHGPQVFDYTFCSLALTKRP